MRRLWYKISQNGVAGIKDPLELQSIVLTNRISSLVVLLIFIFGCILGLRQWNAEPIFVLSSAVLFGFVLLLINWQYFNAGRLFLAMILPLMVVAMSVVSKLIPGEMVSESEYYNYRFVLLGISIIPPIIFGLPHKKLLIISLLPYLFLFLLFDPIHNYFDVGYFQIEHAPSYNITQWIATLMFFSITMGVLILRKTSDEIEIQSKNFQEQQKIKLEEAHARIQQQNEELNVANSQLANKITIANSNLEKTNEELIKNNNELQQFGYAVSHNLRGPVASMLGLVDLAGKESAFEHHPLFEYIRKSVVGLDGIVRDLGTIIDLRNDIFKIRQRTDIKDLIDNTLNTFESEIVEKEVKVAFDIQCKEVFTIKPMLTSIVYNLLSNALKYRSPNRMPTINIETKLKGEKFQLIIRDNGIGINLAANRSEIFGLFKRFNTYTEGKGIGLYLVNLQVKSLGGTIEVESEVDAFTEFKISIPVSENLEYQLLMDQPYAEIFFDSTRDLIGIIWKSKVSSEEYRSVFERSLEFMNQYLAAHCLMDIRKRGPVDPKDELWLLETFLPAIFKKGLKRLAVVYEGQINTNTQLFYKKNQAVFLKYDIQINFCDSVDEAYEWMDESKIET